MVLRTVGEIAESIEDGARDHWHEHVRVEDGNVIVPPHIAAGYAKLRGGRARLRCRSAPSTAATACRS